MSFSLSIENSLISKIFSFSPAFSKSWAQNKYKSKKVSIEKDDILNGTSSVKISQPSMCPEIL
jgi:hypothetical protein